MFDPLKIIDDTSYTHATTLAQFPDTDLETYQSGNRMEKIFSKYINI
jgi:hypothetical protein